VKRQEFELVGWNDRRIPLRIPFEDKEIAKGAGCRWDPVNKIWFIDKNNIRARWACETWPLMKVTDIDLIPSSVWFSNLRSVLPKEEWGIIRKDCYQRWGHKCQECGGSWGNIGNAKSPVEAHEQWSFDEVMGIQVLENVLCLCPDCHMTKHLGLASVKGMLNETLRHLSSVRGISHQNAHLLWRKCMQDWERRSRKEWKLDLRWLRDTYPDKEWTISSDRSTEIMR